MIGADAVVNCVGTFSKGGKNNFDAVQHEGAERIARIAAEQGVGQWSISPPWVLMPKATVCMPRQRPWAKQGVLAHFPEGHDLCDRR